jgi:hypothetical protein
MVSESDRGGVESGCLYGDYRSDTLLLRSPPATRRSVRSDGKCWNYGGCDLTRLSVVAKARGEYVRTHFKNMREVAAALNGG